MFLRHAPCPKCKSKDNLAIYSNGEYCFGCKYTKKYKQEKEEKKETTKFSGLLDETIPEKFCKYLFSFGLSKSILNSYFLYWAEGDRLCFHLRSTGYVEARSLTKEPKVLTFGAKPVYCFPCWPSPGSIMVMVEDAISAIKVSQIYPCAALFGSSLSNLWIEAIKARKLKPIFWLDRDKLKSSKEYRDKFRAMGIESAVIFSPKDPKYYFKYEIIDYVRKTGLTKGVAKVEESGETVIRWNPETSRMVTVPEGSYRANLWPSSVPEFIPPYPIPTEYCWRIHPTGGDMVKVLIGTSDYRLYKCQPDGFPPMATRWSHMEIQHELDASLFETVGLTNSSLENAIINIGNQVYSSSWTVSTYPDSVPDTNNP